MLVSISVAQSNTGLFESLELSTIGKVGRIEVRPLSMSPPSTLSSLRSKSADGDADQGGGGVIFRAVSGASLAPAKAD